MTNKFIQDAQKVKTALDQVYEKQSNKKTTLDADYSTDDDSYPTCKAVKQVLTGKQDTLVSGTNISTINGQSLLNGGDLVVGGGADIVTSWESTLSDTKVPSEKLTKNTLDTKIDKSNTAGLVKNDGTIDTTSYISTLPTGSTSQAGIVQIVDNLTTDDNTKVLSAKQGKALNDTLGDISSVISAVITYINQ